MKEPPRKINVKPIKLMRSLNHWLNPTKIYNPKIETMNFMITDKCNGRCVFCNIGCSYNGEDLGVQDIVNGIFDTFPHLKRFSITGGEPMMHPDIAEIYYVLSRHYTISIVTNAQFPNRVKRFVNINPDARMTTSLHGVGELHDRCMGLKGAFDNFLKTIDYMPGKIGAGMTVCRLNYDKIVEVYDFLTDLGMYFAVNVMDISELYYQNTNLTSMLPSEEMKKTMIEQMKQVRTNQPTWKELQMKLLTGIREDFDCWSGRLQVFIHNSGRIYPCIYMDKVIESLQLGSLKNCSVRQINMQDCRKCLTHCEAMPSISIGKRRQIFFDVLRNKIRKGGIY
jgi:MoaA/NifB/PqqE/SkfB family radical SAM enzyme